MIISKIISKKRLKEIALKLLEVMESEKIESIKSLESMISKKVTVDSSLPDYVSFEIRPSGRTKSYVMSYIVPEKEGIPLEVRLNPALKYSTFILNRNSMVGGYTHFAFDPYGNFIQEKQISSIEIPAIRKELDKLAGKLRK